MRQFVVFCLFCLLIVPKQGFSQDNYGPVHSASAGELFEAIQKMQVTGRVLYIAAHPDDENTRLLAWLAREKKMTTAYLSLTRGDGGQNLIGKEVREGLGLIRTQELLAARRIDGARQFFTRANDFGYSKSPEETFTKWQRDSLLADVVFIIRQFQPDIIITRFNPEPSPTHGHHTASAQLALEAFRVAADSNRFPEQLAFVKPWKTNRIYWNTSWWFYGREDFDKSGLLAINPGVFNHVLGTSYGEIAAESRSMHKSQGFGAARQRGDEWEYLKPLAGDTNTTDLFKGLITDWRRIPHSKTLMNHLQSAVNAFSMRDPSKALPALIEAHQALLQLPDLPIVNDKKQELEQLLAEMSGLWLELTAKNFSYSTGDSIDLQLKVLQRRPAQVVLQQIDWQSLHWADSNGLPYYYTSKSKTKLGDKLSNNRIYTYKQPLLIDGQMPLSGPFWQRGRLDAGFFDLPSPLWVGIPENPANFRVLARFEIQAGGKKTVISLPQTGYYRWTDPVDGERYRPIELLPPASLAFDQINYLTRDFQPQSVGVTVTTHASDISAILELSLPGGWQAVPAYFNLSKLTPQKEYHFTFQLIPSDSAQSGHLQAHLRMGQTVLNHSLQRISYKHLPEQLMMPRAQAKLLLLSVKNTAKKIAFIAGAGDEMPEALTQLGYTVDVLPVSAITAEQLKAYQVVVTGIRAFNIEADLAMKQAVLLDFVKFGGTMIVQYNTSQGLKTSQLGPYPLQLSRDRITVEESPVSLLQPDHPLLTQPNKLTTADFDNWVQERGLYFPGQWDARYEPLFRMQDPGEKPVDGALLYTTYGNGVFIYTGLSFFRQLPAAVPGAYRLLVNMIEATHPDLNK
jgi:LmbE family N-acetylglucosaminyl deacetylase